MSATDKVIGQVKWFNNKAGYGFITIKGGNDVFAHYSNILSGESQYKYLIQGEYVEFDTAEIPDKKEGTPHEFQAVNITGVQGGVTMCEVRRLNRETRDAYRGSGEDDGPDPDVPLRRTASVAVSRAPARGPPRGPPREQVDADGFKVMVSKKTRAPYKKA